MLIRRNEAAVAAELAKSLTAAQARAVEAINAQIGEARRPYITTIPGQEMIYQAKQAEAQAWIAAEAPDLADYPLLSAEIGITAPEADQLAQLWLNMAALWLQVAGQLEAQRLTLTAAVAAATTVAEVEAVLDGL